MPFKFLLWFGKVGQGMTVKEAIDKIKGIAEKHGIKILFQGIPTGMRDQVVVAFHVDEGIDKFYKKAYTIDSDWPLIDSRTHAVFVP